MCRRHSEVGDPKPAPAQRLKDGGLVGVYPSHRLKSLCLAPRGGRLSYCAVGRCPKHWGIFRSESEHSRSRQTALQDSQLSTLEHGQDTSPAQRQDSWNASTRVRHLAPGLREHPAPRGSRGIIAAPPECAEHSGRHCHQRRQVGTQQRLHPNAVVELHSILSRSRRTRCKQRPATAGALAVCPFPGGLQNPSPDLLCLAWSGASVPRELSAADCLQTYQDPPLPFPATALPAQEQTKHVWRPGFPSCCITLLERVTQPSAGCKLPWRLQEKPEDLPPEESFYRFHSET